MRDDHSPLAGFHHSLASRWVVAIAPILLIALGIQPAAAEEARGIGMSSDLALVLDFSGSMNNPSDEPGYFLSALAAGTAKRILQQATRLTDGRTAMVAFGFNKENRFVRQADGTITEDEQKREASCRDIEELFPLTKNGDADIARESALIDALPRAKGETPIVASIMTAARQLVRGGMITLITDLDRDICTPPDTLCEDFRREFAPYRSKGIAVRHIIAITRTAVDTETSQSLSRCAGAQFHVVRTLQDADRAAAAVVDDIALSRPATVTLSYHYAQTPDLVPAPGSSAARAEIDANGPDGAKQVSLDGPGVEATLSFPPAHQHISMALNGLAYQRVLDVPQRQAYRFDLEVPTQRVRLSAQNLERRPLAGDVQVTWTMTESGGRYVATGNPLSVVLAPGTYHVVATAQDLEGEQDVQVGTQGGEASVAVSLDAQTVRSSPAPQPGASVTVAWRADPSLWPDQLRDPRLELTPSVGGAAIDLALPMTASRTIEAGLYSAKLIVDGGVILRETLDVPSGQALNIDIAYHGEALRLATNPESSQTQWVVRARNGASVVLSGSRLEQTMPPGEYTVTATQDGKTVSRDLTMPPDSPAAFETLTFGPK